MEWENNWIEGTRSKKSELNISIDGVKMLQKAIAPYVKKLQERYDKVRDIHEVGEATPAQCDKMCELAEELEFYNAFLKL